MNSQSWREPMHYLADKPVCSARIRVNPEDFVVVEDLGFTPDGEGEHLFLRIRKTGENTDWVARQLANFCQISPRDVSYAGKKDRHAVTEQWFCVHLPKSRALLNFQLFGGDTIEVLEVTRHGRKLRLGSLKGNHFKLRLRDVSDMQELSERIERVRQLGVPNYFGEQRFGFDFGNIEKGLGLLNGTFKERQRNKKGLYISAVRSWLFNRLIDQRLAQNIWTQVLPGDVLMLDGSQSCFINDGSDDSLQQRMEQGDIHLTAPLWGANDLMTQQDARAFEAAVMEPVAEIAQQLVDLGLKQERRAIRLTPKNLAVTIESDRECLVEFSLPSGTFATSVLREICDWHGTEEPSTESD